MISRHVTRLFPQRMIQKTLKSHRDRLKDHQSLLKSHTNLLERHDKWFESIFAGSVGMFIGLLYVSHLAKKGK